ncbi:MAG: hypothetical protein AB2A00_20895, partial [Myxococcota bacterium]
GGVFLGWDSIGPGEVPRALSRVRLTPTPGTVLDVVMGAGSHYLGPLKPEDPLPAALGRTHPKAALLVPFFVKDRLVGVLYGERGERPIPPGTVAALQMLTPFLGRTLEQLIVAHKKARLEARGQTLDPREAELPPEPPIVEPPPDPEELHAAEQPPAPEFAPTVAAEPDPEELHAAEQPPPPELAPPVVAAEAPASEPEPPATTLLDTALPPPTAHAQVTPLATRPGVFVIAPRRPVPAAEPVVESSPAVPDVVTAGAPEVVPDALPADPTGLAPLPPLPAPGEELPVIPAPERPTLVPVEPMPENGVPVSLVSEPPAPASEPPPPVPLAEELPPLAPTAVAERSTPPVPVEPGARATVLMPVDQVVDLVEQTVPSNSSLLPGLPPSTVEVPALPYAPTNAAALAETMPPVPLATMGAPTTGTAGWSESGGVVAPVLPPLSTSGPQEPIPEAPPADWSSWSGASGEPVVPPPAPDIPPGATRADDILVLAEQAPAAELTSLAQELLALPPDGETDSLVRRALARGPDALAATETLLVWRGLATAQVLREFPGPVVVDVFGQELPPASAADIGPLIKLLLKLGSGACVLAVAHGSQVAARAGRYAAVALANEAPAPGVVRYVAERVFDEEDRIRFQAAQVLDRMRGRQYLRSAVSDALALVAEALASPDPGRRGAALAAAGVLKDRSFVPGLVGLLEGQERWLAAESLSTLKELTKQDFGTSGKKWLKWWEENGSRRRVEWMMDALAHRERELRQSAMRELNALTGEYHGYFHDAPKDERDAAVARWLKWWEGARARDDLP